ncbi:lipoprotein 17-related variable surface protein [Mycoplasmopsis agassizii]|uniref:Lipoprotein-associated type-17 domain-containing protein n=1 Tax=Mycoplasmopsis agassizii TaxID=33922 RepID=A0ABX4H4M7_9BACT|nr:lipoprotein 17-related variable surface protein [Mycoplasmopsis agassizii]PAF54762.1 hypothetical protein CJF60_03425 [Mycoplasmopsis agassizii]SMC19524.1 Lipoprotein associated domain-containing protein [Mycoplasmopsis agassizii]
MKKLNKKLLLLSGTVLASSFVATAIACAPDNTNKEENKKILEVLITSINQNYDAKTSYPSKESLISALTADAVKTDKSAFSNLLKVAPKFGDSNLTNAVNSSNQDDLTDKQIRLTLTLSYGNGDDLVTADIDFTISFDLVNQLVDTHSEAIAAWYKDKVIDQNASHELNTKLSSSITLEEDKKILQDFLKTLVPEISGSKIEVDFAEEWSGDLDTSLKVKVTIKINDDTYKENGEKVTSEPNQAGKVITINNLSKRELEQTKIKLWYQKEVNNLTVDSDLKTKAPSAITKSELIPLFTFKTTNYKTKDTDLDLDILEEDDYSGTISLRVFLKQENKYLTTDALKVDDKNQAGKVITLSNFKNLKEAVSNWYKNIVDVSLIDNPKENWKDVFASTITDLEKVKSIFTKPDLQNLPKSDFNVELSADDKAGTLAVKVTLTANNKFYDLNGNNVDQKEAGKKVIISGFKKDTLKEDVTSWYSETIKDEIKVSDFELAKLVPSLVTNEKLKELFKLTLPDGIDNLESEVTLIKDEINNYEGSVKVKITLVQSQTKYFKTDGQIVALANKSDAGKTITLTGFSPLTRYENEVLKWYEKMQATEINLSDLEAMYLPSEVKTKHGFISSFKQKLEMKLPNLPEGFILDFSLVNANDETGELEINLILKADLGKLGSYIFDATTGKSAVTNNSENTPIKKSITIKNLTKKADFASVAYKRLKNSYFPTTFNLKADVWHKSLWESERKTLEALMKKLSETSSSEINDMNELNQAFAKQLEALVPEALRNTFKFELIKNTDLDVANLEGNPDKDKGTLGAQLLLSSTSEGTTKYYSLKVGSDIETGVIEETTDKTAAKGYEITISGFKV